MIVQDKSRGRKSPRRYNHPHGWIFSLCYRDERDNLLTSAFLTRSRLECHHMIYMGAPLFRNMRWSGEAPDAGPISMFS
jgi:hypothetical protein